MKSRTMWAIFAPFAASEPGIFGWRYRDRAEIGDRKEIARNLAFVVAVEFLGVISQCTLALDVEPHGNQHFTQRLLKHSAAAAIIGDERAQELFFVAELRGSSLRTKPAAAASGDRGNRNVAAATRLLGRRCHPPNGDTNTKAKRIDGACAAAASLSDMSLCSTVAAIAWRNEMENDCEHPCESEWRTELHRARWTTTGRHPR